MVVRSLGSGILFNIGRIADLYQHACQAWRVVMFEQKFGQSPRTTIWDPQPPLPCGLFGVFNWQLALKLGLLRLEDNQSRRISSGVDDLCIPRPNREEILKRDIKIFAIQTVGTRNSRLLRKGMIYVCPNRSRRGPRLVVSWCQMA